MAMAASAKIPSKSSAGESRGGPINCGGQRNSYRSENGSQPMAIMAVSAASRNISIIMAIAQ